MKHLPLMIVVLLGIRLSAWAQVSARMMQYPDVSQTYITFSYGGDIWIVPREGGMAHKLTSADGEEMFPRFSPDGSEVAFSANYSGNIDIYVMPSTGGLPVRTTHHGMMDRITDWYPDGQHLIFASSRESGKQRFSQFYKVSKVGGLPEKLPVPYGEFGMISPDGKKIAYTPRTRAFRTWKRYKGGMTADIWIFDLENLTAENISDHDANDEFPMWSGNKLYFLSDRGEGQRNNIWSYDLDSKQTQQVTYFTDFDIHFPSIGGNEIVFEAGGRLYLLDLATEKYREVKVTVTTDMITLMPRQEKVSGLIESFWPSYDGKRAVFEARGELFSVPAENGPILNLTRSSGTAERYPSWSPDGRYIAYWSDRSGEYELTLRDMKAPNEERKLTSYGPGFRYQLFWSPDSKKIAFVDKAMDIYIYDMALDKTVKVDKQKFLYEGGLQNFTASWSSDSRYLAYAKNLENRQNAIAIYDTKDEAVRMVTSGFYNDMQPVFDPDGKYLYFLTNRSFRAVYSDFDNSWIYPNATQIAAIALHKDTPSPLAPKNDTVAVAEEEESSDDDADKKKSKDKKKDDKTDNAEKDVKITWEGLERRLVILPPEAGNYTDLQATSGKVLYRRYPVAGEKGKPSLVYYDLKEREEKTVVNGADAFQVSADGKKVMIASGRNYYITGIGPDKKLDKKMPVGQMEMTVVPREEWEQIFNDAWRFERDFFYDPNMHGVDWAAMKAQYGELIDDAVTRWDVNYVLGELIGEINASHTYKGGGDTEDAPSRPVGYLGIDWGLKNGAYYVKRIIRGAPWDHESRSPLDQPGLKIEEGNYILAVNGQPIDTGKDPWAAFEGLADQTVSLTVSNEPSMSDAWTITVKTMRSETRLRNLAWIESKRKRVDEATGGKIGYIYVPSTGADGQYELVRMFYPQFNKKGLIIDERFNNGGQIPDRFIELLDRDPLAFWAVRDGQTWQWPPVAHFGPKVMLINGWSGSGGDAFPDYFRKAGLGPLVGTRTWGGLIGITGAPSLIDGGTVTVPTFRMYNPDGTWFKEGYGVDPDIEVIDDPAKLAQGIDPQLEKAIEEALRLLENGSPAGPDQPAYESR